MTMSKRSHGTPAPYGKSCETCSRAKCKCILRPEGGACDRCHRLKKICHPSETRRGHRPASRYDIPETSRIDEAVGRTVQLEERFNQLVASLQPATQLDGSTNTFETLPMTPLSAKSSDPANSANPQRGNRADSQSLSDYVRCAVNIDPQQAESLLNDFKSDYLKWFPFVYLPDTLTSKQLCSDRPMLWLAIMVTCHPSQDEKQRLDNLYRRTIADEMVVNARKSIDFLLSLLCFVGWYQNHCLREDGTMRLSLSLLQQMAISLVYDLRKPASIHPTQVLSATLHRSNHSNGDRLSQDAARTNEERRAFIACSYLTSTIAAYIPRIEPIRWSGHLNDSLRTLEASPECVNDEILVHYVHLQLVQEKTALLRWYEDFMDTPEHMQVPPSFYDHTLRQRLHQLKDKIPTHLQDNQVLRLQYTSVELAINELWLTESSVLQKLLPPANFRSRKVAFSCMSSVRSWFETFCSMPATLFLGQSFSFGVQALRCLGLLFFLSKMFKEAGEDLEFPPDVEPLRLLDCVLDKVQSTITTARVVEDSYLYRFQDAFRQLRHTCAVEYATNVDVVTDNRLPPGTSAENGTTTLLDGNTASNNRRDDTYFSDFPEFDMFDAAFLLGWQPMHGF